MPYAAETYSLNLLSEENVKKYVLPQYGLENSSVNQIKFKNTDKQRAVYKVDYNNNSFCLKKIYFPLDELLFVYSSIEWFYRYGINVPRILPTLDRSRYVNYSNMLFILTPWIDGIKCNYDIEEHVFLCAENLAKMHFCSKNFVPLKGSSHRTGFNDLYVSTEKHFGQLLNCSNLAFKHKDKFSRRFLQHFDENLIMARSTLSVASTINSSNLKKALCHLDYVNKNIIFDDNKNIWVIDFDKCRIDHCVHDICYFMRRLLRRDKTRWSLKLAVDCLNYYEKIRPLNLDEYKYILVYLCFPQKYWKISRDYYKNINKCNKSSFIKLLDKAVENDNYQLDFLHKFSEYIENKFDTNLNL
ncbi:CotS family spore coat protein [Clostridium lundense]|uniref:CotS family spore coat protein n=1 Tax=Clostridium lundense TaxID=319475 RepID=UPI00047F97D0|nr:CotS family spore coat protein [Clostridium lundense]